MFYTPVVISEMEQNNDIVRVKIVCTKIIALLEHDDAH